MVAITFDMSDRFELTLIQIKDKLTNPRPKVN